ncbi:MAG: zf-HC2 domain-containing protein [Anaerolineae bacterium]
MAHETCKNLLSQLSDYIDGELEAALCEEIERHMADCPDCRVVVNTLQKTIELYRTGGRVEVPAEVKHRLYRVLQLDQIGHSPS